MYTADRLFYCLNIVILLCTSEVTIFGTFKENVEDEI